MRSGLWLAGRALPGCAGGCVVAMSVLLAACSVTQQRKVAALDASAADARVPATAYRPVLGGYVSQRPVEPAPWREQNERVAPAPKR